MDTGDDVFDDTYMDLDVGPAPPKPSRFQPKIKGKGKLKAEPPPSPSLAHTLPPPASETISHSNKTDPSKDCSVPNSNGVIAAETEAESTSMAVDEEEDVVVQEFDIYLNPTVDADTKLYDMQYPLRPSWRPYEIDERCNEVRIKPKLSHFEIELNLDVDNDENYNKQVDDNLMITTQTLSSSSKPFANEYAVGVLRGNLFYVNPLHAIAQFRPSMAHVQGVQKSKQGGHQLESNSKPIENIKETLKMPNSKALQKDAKEDKEHIDVDEPWVLLTYHASDSPASRSYLEKLLTNGRNYIPLSMKSFDYLSCYGFATLGNTRKTAGPSKRYLLSKPLEDRLKKWFSEGPQVNHFKALLHLAPSDPVEDVLRLLQQHACLVQGLWVSKSSLLHNGLAALFRDYILLQFSKSHAVHDGKLRIVKPDDLRKSLLKPLAVERSLLKDWKFKEGIDLSFIKQYPEIVKEQEYAWSIREKEILESLPGVGRSISSMLKGSANLGMPAKGKGHHRDIHDARSSVDATMLSKDQQALAKAILELLHLYKVLSLNAIIQGLHGKEIPGSREVENVAGQIATKVHDIYVLKSSGKPELDQFRSVVIEYFIGKGRNAKVKKQEIKLAAQHRLKKDVSDADYGLGHGWECLTTLFLKTGKLKTSVKKNNINPEWNEDLTLSISEPLMSIKLHVYDKDTFSRDDKMGDAEFEIAPFIEAVKISTAGLPDGTIITMVRPCRQNCLAGESPIFWKDGRMVQDLVLRLRNVERGEIELQLKWIDIPGAPGF